MAQYKTGTANVTNGSATVTGSGTLWASNVNPGDGFTVAGTGVPYTVAAVASNTSLTLSAPYRGTSRTGSPYALFRDFTTANSIPELSQGDIETATIFTRAMRVIDGAIGSLDNLALQGTVGVYSTVAAGEAATESGDYFFVASTSPESLALYTNDAGTGVLVGTYPLLEQIEDAFDARLVDLQQQQDDFQEAHVRLARSYSVIPDQNESLRLDYIRRGYGVGDIYGGVSQAKLFGQIHNFSRSSVGTYFGPDGLIREAAVNEPRFQYDPTTLEPLGLLIEEQRTNLLLWSDDLTNAAWLDFSALAGGGSFSTVVIDPALSGTVFDATEITSDGRLQKEYRLGSVVGQLVGKTCVTTICVHKSSTGIARLYLYATTPETLSLYVAIDSNTGSVVNASMRAHNARYEVSDNGSYWRVSIIIDVPETFGTSDLKMLATLATATGSPVLNPGYHGKVVYFGAQVEEGSSPASYIPTNGTQVTRAVDNCSRTLGAEFNPEQGVIYTEFMLVKQGHAPNVWGAANDNLIRAEFSASNLLLVFDLRGVNQGFKYTSLSGVEGINKLAVSYSDGVIVASLNGEQETLSVSESLGAHIDGIVLGDRAGGGNNINAPISRFRYFPHALSEAELITLTTP